MGRGQRILRVLGVILLTVCGAMFVLGMTIWEDALRGPLFMIYWGWCLLLAVITIFLALWDMVLVRRAFRQQRRELFRQEFMTKELIDKIRTAIDRDEDK